MDANLLRSWIGLPHGPWPPADRVLLGLTPGPVNPMEAERRVLERMALLRPHQLLHPDLVTEGMNRLAQALLAVTAFAPAPEETTPRPDTFAPEVDLQAVVVDAPTIMEAEAILEAEAVHPGPTAPAPSPRSPRNRRQDLSSPGAIPDFTDLPTIPVPEPGSGDRRTRYRELAGLRALRRATLRLRPFFGNPNNLISTPGRVLDFLEGTIELRNAMQHRGVDFEQFQAAAPVLVAIAGEPLPLAVFRSLSHSQRLQLARERAAVQTWLDSFILQIRDSLRSQHRGPRAHSGGRLRYLGQHPEWLLAAMTFLVLAMTGIWAFLR